MSKIKNLNSLGLIIFRKGALIMMGYSGKGLSKNFSKISLLLKSMSNKWILIIIKRNKTISHQFPNFKNLMIRFLLLYKKTKQNKIVFIKNKIKQKKNR